MKKFLLSLPICLISLSSQAGWNYDISSSAKALYGYSFADSSTPQAISSAYIDSAVSYDFSSQNKISLHLDLSGGIDKELENYNQGRWGENIYAIWEIYDNQIMFGQQKSVAYLFNNGVSYVGAIKSQNDIVDFLANPNWRRDGKNTRFSTLNSTAINTDGSAIKINYITPEYSGMALGFSYMPDNYSRDGLIDSKISKAHKDGFVASSYWDKDFNFFTSQQSLSFAVFNANEKEFSYSLNLSRGNWNIGFGYRDTYIDGDDKTSSQKDDYFNSYREAVAYDVGIGYEFGPVQTSLSYFYSDSKNTAHTTESLTFSNQYQFNQNFDIYLAGTYLQYQDNQDISDGVAAIFGIGVNF